MQRNDNKFLKILKETDDPVNFESPLGFDRQKAEDLFLEFDTVLLLKIVVRLKA